LHPEVALPEILSEGGKAKEAAEKEVAPVEFGSNRSAAEKARKRIEYDSDSDREGGEATEHSGGREIGAASRVWQRCKNSSQRRQRRRGDEQSTAAGKKEVEQVECGSTDQRLRRLG